MEPARELAAMMALRVRGRVTAAEVARAAACPLPDAEAVLAALVDRGAAAPVAAAAGALALTAGGRAELGRRLADERLDRAGLAACYERFLAADRALKAAITEWQLADEAGKRIARAALVPAAAAARGVAAEIAAIAPRFAPYGLRLAAAADAVAGGDPRFVASPRVDSLHQVWFELHEDLLATLGRTRAT